jgi:hypothetical protein
VLSVPRWCASPSQRPRHAASAQCDCADRGHASKDALVWNLDASAGAPRPITSNMRRGLQAWIPHLPSVYHTSTQAEASPAVQCLFLWRPWWYTRLFRVSIDRMCLQGGQAARGMLLLFLALLAGMRTGELQQGIPIKFVTAKPLTTSHIG